MLQRDGQDAASCLLWDFFPPLYSVNSSLRTCTQIGFSIKNVRAGSPQSRSPTERKCTSRISLRWDSVFHNFPPRKDCEKVAAERKSKTYWFSWTIGHSLNWIMGLCLNIYVLEIWHPEPLQKSFEGWKKSNYKVLVEAFQPHHKKANLYFLAWKSNLFW